MWEETGAQRGSTRGSWWPGSPRARLRAPTAPSASAHQMQLCTNTSMHVLRASEQPPWELQVFFQGLSWLFISL